MFRHLLCDVYGSRLACRGDTDRASPYSYQFHNPVLPINSFSWLSFRFIFFSCQNIKFLLVAQNGKWKSLLNREKTSLGYKLGSRLHNDPVRNQMSPLSEPTLRQEVSQTQIESFEQWLANRYRTRHSATVTRPRQLNGGWALRQLKTESRESMLFNADGSNRCAC